MVSCEPRGQVNAGPGEAPIPWRWGDFPLQSLISRAGGRQLGQNRAGLCSGLFKVLSLGCEASNHLPRWFFLVVMMGHCGAICGHHGSGTLGSTLDLKCTGSGKSGGHIYCVFLPTAAVKKALPRDLPSASEDSLLPRIQEQSEVDWTMCSCEQGERHAHSVSTSAQAIIGKIPAAKAGHTGLHSPSPRCARESVGSSLLGSKQMSEDTGVIWPCHGRQ